VHAILDSASQVAAPALVSTLSICIVFLPVVLLTGAARYLFTPLAEAVVFAMLASYFLSRTLVPTMMHYLLPAEIPLYQSGEKEHLDIPEAQNWVWRVHERFNVHFERLRHRYHDWLAWTLDHRALVLIVFGIFVLGSSPLLFIVGRDFFPYVDSGQMRLHVAPPPGTRLEEAEVVFAQVEAEIRRVVTPQRMDMILDNIGLPNGGINLAFGDSATISNSDGDILIALKPGKRETQELQRRLRVDLRAKFPNETFFFTPANMTNQILNFGLPAPIDIQIVGRNPAGYRIATNILQQVEKIPGAVDAHIHQQVTYPAVDIDVNRSRAQQIGLQQRDVANSLLISLSGTGQTAPNEWLNPENGVNYQLVVQTPQYRLDTFSALQRTPLTSPQGNTSQLLANISTLKRGVAPIVINHYDIQPVYDIYADVDQRDLGGVAGEIRNILAKQRKGLPNGTTLDLRGEVQTMEESFTRLTLGIGFAVILVYLLMAVNFQSWVDPLIILFALPGAFSGILWMLYLTQTTFSVPSLMGSIMTIGVATANSILLVVFANDQRGSGKNERDAAQEAGFIRLRPVFMTALAMIIGMLPMAMALGEGGEQNAPLGRAVIGGLLVATVTTLFIVPIIYTFLRKETPIDYDEKIDREYKGDNNPGQNQDAKA
jgi:multidrug efflux pump subunit AcrB